MSSFRNHSKRPKRSSSSSSIRQPEPSINDHEHDVDFWFDYLDQIREKAKPVPAFCVNISSVKAYQTSLQKMSSTHETVCAHCRTELIRNNDMWTCSDCGASQVIELEGTNTRTKSFSMAYKRINHLAELLTQLQAKESTIISDKIIDEIKGELKKRRLAHIVNVKTVRHILKELGYNKLYEHTLLIFSKIADKPPPSLTREQEQEIRRSFLATLRPFSI